ncbi:hypothetical protein NEMBOFW57_010808 [Staphylotrichum longicolle]|uniref:LysM domain-containing protein n=1 Tax=Staphylotrichum longicolle TaxID=669026 RepID=A0AAD4ENQ7_9PEZI|nr:hypothetical protein NEMBOFW57_010808 [Staphylotrichum longicolle]
MASNAQQAHQLDKRGDQPAMQWDLNTIGTCSCWYDNYEGLTCKEVRDWKFAISPADFSRWNPSITLDCGNWQALSYCVENELNVGCFIKNIHHRSDGHSEP